ncbi:L-glutamate gamma-semialdehyde dehydrogenase [Micromonospora sonneratiae]|uniref:L-glutamate gamma-semialdehyde dehydrogenase n=1 Tax=Micromonospora sonneratiae TaxID=1184706 RepID=A0ABW3Y6S5_9ACTN
MDAVATIPAPVNERVLTFVPGSQERSDLAARIKELAATSIELPMSIGGGAHIGQGERIDVVQPHRHQHVLGHARSATAADVSAAILAARTSAHDWQALSFEDRAAVFLRAAQLLAGPWRATLLAATMLGQSKSVHQAEIDICELVDFWRFNVAYARQIQQEQPESAPGEWNRVDYRPLEGFVYAVTPFNFTAIAGNLPTAPALMGNTVVWKPASTQLLAAHHTMRLLEEAGLPPGVINLVTGPGPAISDVVLSSPDLAGVHFTGSTSVFQQLWSAVGQNLPTYRSYPRLVGETGGKNFVLVHPSADVETLPALLVRGAFEYQGQKCSAASRAYIPRSIWNRVRDPLLATISEITYGDVCADLSAFGGAVIDSRAHATISKAIERARGQSGITVAVGGDCPDDEGWFVQPTLLVGEDPLDEIFTVEYFGPLLAVHVYDDADYAKMLPLVEQSTRYGLTGSIVARDPNVIAHATRSLRFAAGNLYVNDKPTGAVVGQQPFGGGRASGTNDKAGSPHNLLRWTSPRCIKQNFAPPRDYRYPHMSGQA